MPHEYHSCADRVCQCYWCENDSFRCCFGRPIHCPDSADYDRGYVCPDFVPKNSTSALDPCPACGGAPKVRARKGKFRIECNGDCWTETGWHDTIDAAREEWRSIRQEREEDDNATE